MNKKLPLIVICLAAIALGGTCIEQHLKIKTLAAKVEVQSKAIAQQSQEMNEVRKDSEAVAQQKTWLAQESTALREKIKTLQTEIAESQTAKPQPDANPTPDAQPAKPASGFKGMLAEMMKDPDQLEMMRKQQAFHIESQLGGLIKALQITPDQGRKLVDLLVQQQTAAMESVPDELPLSQSDMDKVAKRDKENQSALKSLLGDAKYAKYQEYQKAAPSRIETDQLRQQLASTQAPLQDFQAQLVAKTIQEEDSRKIPGSISQADLNPEDYSNPDKLDALFAAMEERNKRVLNSAKSYLSAPQLEALAKSQARSLETQKMGIKMLSKMLQSQ